MRSNPPLIREQSPDVVPLGLNDAQGDRLPDRYYLDHV